MFDTQEMDPQTTLWWLALGGLVPIAVILVATLARIVYNIVLRSGDITTQRRRFRAAFTRQARFRRAARDTRDLVCVSTASVKVSEKLAREIAEEIGYRLIGYQYGGFFRDRQAVFIRQGSELDRIVAGQQVQPECSMGTNETAGQRLGS